MKKFILASILLLLCSLGFYIAVYYYGFFINLDKAGTITVVSKTDGKTILIANGNSYEEIIVKGVEVSSNIPGHYTTDYAVDEKTWEHWFSQIAEMGANTIRIATVYEDTFYNAFYEYNRNHDKPLYLLQGISVTDYANDSGQDAYSAEFYGSLIKDAHTVVDIIHGRKNIMLNEARGSGIYRKDISKWVLGYIIGSDWDTGTVAYTNNQSKYSTQYIGSYIETTPDATVFEALLARVMDELISYETNKYKMQHIISFINKPENDPFEYDEFYAKQIGKYNQIDAEHLMPTNQLQSGYFASYSLYEYCDNFADYFSEEQRESLKMLLPSLDKSLYYEGYTQLLNSYHTIPVLIASYGYSSGRGIENIREKEGPLTEKEQGEHLAATYQDVIDSGCVGAVISSWQDIWQRRTWNTSYAVDNSDVEKWHDIQTSGQGYGLLSFESGKEKRICYIDGDTSEWNQEQLVWKENGYELYMTYDLQAIYFMVRKVGLTDQMEFFIPVDITPNSGSMVYEEKFLFDRPVDFLIWMNGQQNSRLLVQARYEAVRENYLYQIAGEDPFVTYPDKNASDFVPIYMILENKKIVHDITDEEEMKKIKQYDVFETGKLICGNGNPNNEKYNSQADFCYGKDAVEIRIPWLLFNVSNPVEMKIHDDYYNNYGVEHISISNCYVGIAEGEIERSVQLASFDLNKISKILYHERLKEAYYAMKGIWNQKSLE